MKKILIVDDDPDNIEVIKYKLKRSSVGPFEIIEALRGDDAIEAAKNHSLDIVLLDVMMPLVNGFEVCREIKGFSKDNFIPIILITAREDLDSKLEGFQAGADDYLAKPYDFQELEARIKAMLNIKDLQDRLRAANEELKITSQKLVEAERLAAIGEIVASINHEINNPLCSIMLNAQMLREEVTTNPAKVKKRSQTIERNVERIQDLTRKIQDLKDSATVEYVRGERMINLDGDG